LAANRPEHTQKKPSAREGFERGASDALLAGAALELRGELLDAAGRVDQALLTGVSRVESIVTSRRTTK
jgi:hypothetical protein